MRVSDYIRSLNVLQGSLHPMYYHHASSDNETVDDMTRKKVWTCGRVRAEIEHVFICLLFGPGRSCL